MAVETVAAIVPVAAAVDAVTTDPPAVTAVDAVVTDPPAAAAVSVTMTDRPAAVKGTAAWQAAVMTTIRGVTVQETTVLR